MNLGLRHLSYSKVAFDEVETNKTYCWCAIFTRSLQRFVLPTIYGGMCNTSKPVAGKSHLLDI